MADVRLVQGTIEYVLHDWEDTLGNVTSLAGLAPKYEVWSSSGTVYQYITNGTSTFVGMKQYSLIDTTASPVGSPSGGGLWLPGTYKCWVRLTANLGAEQPKLGSFIITVDAG